MCTCVDVPWKPWRIEKFKNGRGGHKLHKPSKESGIFQSLSSVQSCFTKRQSGKGVGHGTLLPPLLRVSIYTVFSVTSLVVALCCFKFFVLQSFAAMCCIVSSDCITLHSCIRHLFFKYLWPNQRGKRLLDKIVSSGQIY